jgi:putative transposase
MILTQKYKLLPTKKQRHELDSILELQRDYYNYALNQRIWEYQNNKVSLTKFDQNKDLTVIRSKQTEYRDLPATLTRWTIDKLDKSMKSFFRRVKAGETPGFPRYKGKGKIKSFGFTFMNGVLITLMDKQNNISSHVIFKGISSSLRIHQHRDLPHDAKVKGLVLTKKCNAWSVAVQYEVDRESIIDAEYLQDPVTYFTRTACDWGRENALTFHDGQTLETVRVKQRHAKKIKYLQQAVSRSKLGSKSRRKKVNVLGKAMHDEKNARLTHLHQVSAKAVKMFQCIGVEDLAVKNMTRKGGNRKKGLNKGILDGAPSTLMRLMSYKAEKAGGLVVTFNPRYTSQDCSTCWAMGVHTRVKKKLSERVHRCEVCDVQISRDVNASWNGFGRCYGVTAMQIEMQRRGLIEREGLSFKIRDEFRRINIVEDNVVNIAESNVGGVVAPRWIKSVVGKALQCNASNVEKRDNLSAFEACAEAIDDRNSDTNSQETRNISLGGASSTLENLR